MKESSEKLPRNFTINTPLFMKRVITGKEKRCIRCRGKVKGEELLCSVCRRAQPDDTILSLDTLYFMVSVSLIMAILLTNPGGKLPQLINPDTIPPHAVLLIILLPPIALIPPYISAWRLFQNRSVIISFSFIVGCVLTLSGTALQLGSATAEMLIYPLAGLALLLPSYKLITNTNPQTTLILLLGIALVFIPFVRSSAEESPGSAYWFLSNSVLASTGLLLLYISSNMYLRQRDLMTKAALPHTIWTVATVFTSTSLLRLWNRDINSPGDLFPLYLGVVLLLIAISMYVHKRSNEAAIEANLRTMEESLEKSRKLFREGHLFYALQLVDRALKENMVNALGREKNYNSILYRIEKPSSSRYFNITPGEYEIAYNEKARILVAQYNIPGAISQYLKAIQQNPDYLESYSNLAFLFSTLPGREAEATRYMNYYLTSKRLHLSRWLAEGLPLRYVKWAERSNTLLLKSTQLKMEILKKIGNPQEVGRYYSLREALGTSPQPGKV